MKRIKRTYGDLNKKNRKANLEKVSKLHPEVKNVKENEGVGSMIMHTLTTLLLRRQTGDKNKEGYLQVTKNKL